MTLLRQAYNHAMDQIIFMRKCLTEWDLELREGDGSLYHELAEALRTLREYIFLNEAELRARHDARGPQSPVGGWHHPHVGCQDVRDTRPRARSGAVTPADDHPDA